MRFTDIVLTRDGDAFKGQDDGIRFSANLPMFLIHEAWARGADFEALADGFGPGEGTHGDWSAIRDSSDVAVSAMFEVALNILFGAKCDCGFALLYRGNRHTPECAVTAGQVEQQVATVHAALETEIEDEAELAAGEGGA